MFYLGIFRNRNVLSKFFNGISEYSRKTLLNDYPGIQMQRLRSLKISLQSKRSNLKKQSATVFLRTPLELDENLFMLD